MSVSEIFDELLKDSGSEAWITLPLLFFAGFILLPFIIAGCLLWLICRIIIELYKWRQDVLKERRKSQLSA